MQGALHFIGFLGEFCAFCQGLEENHPHYSWPGLFFFFFTFSSFFFLSSRKSNGRESAQTEAPAERAESDYGGPPTAAMNETEAQTFW